MLVFHKNASVFLTSLYVLHDLLNKTKWHYRMLGRYHQRFGNTANMINMVKNNQIVVWYTFVDSDKESNGSKDSERNKNQKDHGIELVLVTEVVIAVFSKRIRLKRTNDGNTAFLLSLKHCYLDTLNMSRWVKSQNFFVFINHNFFISNLQETKNIVLVRDKDDSLFSHPSFSITLLLLMYYRLET